MNKRRSICKLFGKLGIISFYSSSVFSSVITHSKEFDCKEIKLFSDSLNSGTIPPHFKLRPGESIKISLANNVHCENSRNILFKMPLISLRPYILFETNQKDPNLPLVILSAIGKPLKEN